MDSPAERPEGHWYRVAALRRLLDRDELEAAVALVGAWSPSDLQEAVEELESENLLALNDATEHAGAGGAPWLPIDWFHRRTDELNALRGALP